MTTYDEMERRLLATERTLTEILTESRTTKKGEILERIRFLLHHWPTPSDLKRKFIEPARKKEEQRMCDHSWEILDRAPLRVCMECRLVENTLAPKEEE